MKLSGKNSLIPIVVFTMCHVLQLLMLFSVNVRSNVVVCMVLFLVIYHVLTNQIYIKLNAVSILFSVFMFIMVMSLSNYLLNGFTRNLVFSRPSLFFTAFSYNIIPITGFFCLSVFVSNNNIYFETFKLNLVVLNIISIIISIVLYYSKPSFYVHYLASGLVSIDTNQIDLGIFRLGGYFGSQILSNVAMVNVFLVLSLKAKRCFLLKLLAVILSILAIVMSQQRGAIAGLILGAAFVLIVGCLCANKETIQVILLLTLVVVILACIFFVFGIESRQSSRFSFDMLVEAVSERIPIWFRSIDIIRQFPFGVGVNIMSQKAYGVNQMRIADGYIFKVLAELGIPGVFVFGLLFVAVVVRTSKMQEKWLSGFFVANIVQSMGTNVISFYYSSFMFWFFVGFVGMWTKKKGSSSI